jgi:hypothetical protein
MASVSTAPYQLTMHRRTVCLRSSSRNVPSALVGRFFLGRSPPRLLNAAAPSGLKPAPASRLREAYSHLQYSTRNRFRFVTHSCPQVLRSEMDPSQHRASRNVRVGAHALWYVLDTALSFTYLHLSASMQTGRLSGRSRIVSSGWVHRPGTMDDPACIWQAPARWSAFRRTYWPRPASPSGSCIRSTGGVGSPSAPCKIKHL